jgi:hypothetical protein
MLCDALCAGHGALTFRLAAGFFSKPERTAISSAASFKRVAKFFEFKAYKGGNLAVGSMRDIIRPIVPQRIVIDRVIDVPT